MLGRFIAQRRKERNLTQRELAERRARRMRRWIVGLAVPLGLILLTVLGIAMYSFQVQGKLFISQRGMWVPSFMFHFGIYIMLAWSFCLFIPAFWPIDWVVAVMSFVGILGFAMTTIGAAILLIQRITREDLRVFTTPEEYFNLIAILVVLITGIYCWMNYDVFTVAHQVLTLDAANIAPIVLVHLVLMGALMIYIPISKMGHYAGKFFCFRSVFWDNNPNMVGSATEKKMKAAAAQPVTTKWSAPHCQPAPAKDSEE